MSTTYSPGHLQTSAPLALAKASLQVNLSPRVKPSNEVPAPPKRRSTRLTISIPILVRGKDEQGVSFAEQAQTLVVSLHGAMIALPRLLSSGSEVLIENPASQKAAEVVVLWCKQKTGQPSCHEAAVALKQPQDLWGINFPSWEKECPASAASPRDARSTPKESPSAAPPEPGAATVPPAEKHRCSGEDARAPVEGSASPSSATSDQVVDPRAQAGSPTDADSVVERERFNVSLKELCAASVEEVRLLAEAHVRLFNGTLAKRALDSRDTCLKELEQSLAEIKRSIQEELQKQMEQQLEVFARRASEQADCLAESVLKAVEAKIATIQFCVVPTKAAGN